MSESGDDQDVSELLVELTRSLEQLESELEPDRRFRPPTPQELTRFTSEIAIPAVILLLRTNVKTLQLLQRTLRLAEGRSAGSDSGRAGDVQQRAAAAGRATLAKLDDALEEVQSTLKARPPDDEARELLDQARDLQTEVAERLEHKEDSSPAENETSVDIDVESELQSIKDNLDENGDQNADGTGDDHGGENEE